MPPCTNVKTHIEDFLATVLYRMWFAYI